MEKIHPVIKLFISIILLYVGWFVLYNYLLQPGGTFDVWLTKLVTQNSVGIINIFDEGFSVYVNPAGKCTILLNLKKIISVNHACNGQVLYPVFMSFIIVTRGKWINKSLMIILGFIIIYSVNIIRIISLVYVRLYHPKYLDFNHKYTFVILVYAVIFGLWVFWVNKFSKFQFIKNAKIK